jgi:hypothetical protein
LTGVVTVSRFARTPEADFSKNPMPVISQQRPCPSAVSISATRAVATISQIASVLVSDVLRFCRIVDVFFEVVLSVTSFFGVLEAFLIGVRTFEDVFVEVCFRRTFEAFLTEALVVFLARTFEAFLTEVVFLAATLDDVAVPVFAFTYSAVIASLGSSRHDGLQAANGQLLYCS